MKHLMFILVMVVLATSVLADFEDNYFSVRDIGGPYEIQAGEDIDVTFKIANRDLMFPRNVTAYVSPCPVGWACERKTLSFNTTDKHDVSLNVQISKSTLPKKYTLYILLESEYMTRRGDDVLRITVLSDEQAKTLTYEEYLEKQEEDASAVPTPNPALKTQEQIAKETAAQEIEPEVIEEVAPVDVVEEGGEPENETTSELLQNVENLETSKQFIEYITFVLIIVLVVIAVGGFITYRKNKE